MFSAKNARDLKKSMSLVGIEVEKITSAIETAIHTDHGTSKYFHQMGSGPKNGPAVELITTQMTDIVHHLNLLGYTMEWQWEGNPYVPRGLQDDDGNGKLYDNFGILISWGE